MPRLSIYGSTPSKGTWVRVECPARLDLAGGLTDIAPICYENGSAVCNVAVLVNGKRPNGVCVRLIDEPIIKLIHSSKAPEHGADGGPLLDNIEHIPIFFNSIDDLRDYNKPNAIGLSYQ